MATGLKIKGIFYYFCSISMLFCASGRSDSVLEVLI